MVVMEIKFMEHYKMLAELVPEVCQRRYRYPRTHSFEACWELR